MIKVVLELMLLLLKLLKEVFVLVKDIKNPHRPSKDE